jgi:hypothetical protein
VEILLDPHPRGGRRLGKFKVQSSKLKVRQKDFELTSKLSTLSFQLDEELLPGS